MANSNFGENKKKMRSTDNIIIQLESTQTNTPLNPHTIDITQLTQLLNDIQELIGRKKNQKSQYPITLAIESGSVKIVISAATFILSGLIADLKHIETTKSLEGISVQRRSIFEQWIDNSKRKSLQYKILTPETQHESRVSEWGKYQKGKTDIVRMEKIITGEVIQYGSHVDPCYHLQLADGRRIILQTDQDTLHDDKNRIYRHCYAHVSFDYSLSSKTESNFKLMEWVDDYEAGYDEDSLSRSIMMAADSFSDIDDPVAWTNQLRGNDED
jgi:hypothetical protein